MKDLKLRLKILTVSLTAFLFLYGCAAVRPEFSTPQEKERTFSSIIKILKARNLSITTLRCQARIKISSGFFSRAEENIILAERPASLRVDTLDESGGAIQQMSARGEKITFYWPAENTFVTDKADKSSLEKYISVPMDLSTAVVFLTGGVPLDQPQKYDIVISKNGRSYVLKSPSSEITVDRDTLLPLRFEKEGEYAVKFEKYKNAGRVVFPTEISADFKDPKTTLKINFKDIELNKRISKNSFEIKIPKDARWNND